MRVFQIWFDYLHLPFIEKEYIEWKNTDCTVFFESEVIRELVEKRKYHLLDDYFGVVSYQLRQKLGYMKENWKNNKNIANISTSEFTPKAFEEEVYKHKPDVMSFQRHAPHDPVAVASCFHPKFKIFWQHIMDKLGYKWQPEVYENIFYCHFFVAKSEVYERYVKELLAPAMDVMKDMPELMENSMYNKPLPENLKQKFGISHWPYHSFICERFMSYFAHIHKLDCKHF